MKQKCLPTHYIEIGESYVSFKISIENAALYIPAYFSTRCHKINYLSCIGYILICLQNDMEQETSLKIESQKGYCQKCNGTNERLIYGHSCVFCVMDICCRLSASVENLQHSNIKTCRNSLIFLGGGEDEG